MTDVVFKIYGESVDELADDAEMMLELIGDDILTRAQRLVPKRTWSLHDSLMFEVERPSRGRVEVLIGVDDDFVGPFGDVPALYAAIVESGSSLQPAQPYLMPALLQTIGSLK